MKIIELNEGELPYMDCAVYPNLGLKLFKTKILFSSRFKYYIASDFFVKINRDGFNYLIRVKDIYESEYEDVFYSGINTFVAGVNFAAIQISDKYIVDENVSTDFGSGLDTIVFKYKKSKYAEV